MILTPELLNENLAKYIFVGDKGEYRILLAIAASYPGGQPMLRDRIFEEASQRGIRQVDITQSISSEWLTIKWEK